METYKIQHHQQYNTNPVDLHILTRIELRVVNRNLSYTLSSYI